MNLKNLKQAPFAASLVGALRGALDFYGLEASDAVLFGATGNAFLINIHKELCPSGPYCWHYDEFVKRLENLGLRMTHISFYSPGNSPADRASIENNLKTALDAGVVCSLLNLENQLISGYDQTGFDVTQPWPDHDFPPNRLTYSSWAELGDEFHISFYTLEKVAPADRKTAIIESLEYAVDMWRNPRSHTYEDYGLGSEGYDNFIGAVEEFGASHGNWWNAKVYSEGRAMASHYFTEIGELLPNVADYAAELSAAYADLAKALETASDKGLEPSAKIALLKGAKIKEAAAVDKIAELAAALHK